MTIPFPFPFPFRSLCSRYKLIPHFDAVVERHLANLGPGWFVHRRFFRAEGLASKDLIPNVVAHMM